jgi:putative pyruvate formate lyase activating enzyme
MGAAYLELERTGELARRAEALLNFYRHCELCPRGCRVDRTRGEMGVCRTGAQARVAAAHPHFGEEAPLVGRGGSGTIFFSQCNLRCVFCQNWEIAHEGEGELVTDEELAGMMLALERRGCHNINLVTPTHVVPSIVAALGIAARRGLRLPLVYNCGGYERVEALRLLDGVIDIYLPDFKYTDGAMADKYSPGARDYPERAAAAIVEMHRQVGDLITGEPGVAVRGLMVRHLLMPGDIAGTPRFLEFVERELGRATYVNLMRQYRPAGRAGEFPELRLQS